ncbi:MAG: Ni/Fe hydrogenase subunit alpha [Candidatus Thorarchaeota archaeon]
MSKIEIKPVIRIESHGQLTMEFESDGSPKRAYFSTPVIRGFEAFLAGAPIERIPWLASRVCGVCPVSHAVTAAKTIEKSIGIKIPETAEVLREILVLSQLIDSHALSFFVLSLPDLLPRPDMYDIVDIKRELPDLFEKGMTLHSLGRKMTSLIGGRNVHPANVRVGGMGTNPLLNTEFDMKQGLADALDIGKLLLSSLKEWFAEESELVSSLGDIQSNYMAISNNGVVSFTKGTVRVVDATGAEVANFVPEDYQKYLDERIEPHTYMKLPYLLTGGSDDVLRVNCLARANVNESYGTPIADQELKELKEKFGFPLQASLLSHWVRLIELIYACERLQILLDSPASKGTRTSVDADIVDGETVGVLEAPRGTLFHHYKIQDGQIAKANLLVATQNNGLAINRALSQTLEYGKRITFPQEKITHHCEMVIRAYDPCISCSTHVVQVKEDEL